MNPDTREALAALLQECRDFFENCPIYDGAGTNNLDTRCMDAIAALATQPVQPSAQGEAVAWLVEWKAHGHGPQWWGFNHTPGKNATWCSDANNAIRFARKEDAERMRLHVIAVAGLTGMHEYERSVSVTEHMWIDTASAPAAQPSAQYEEVGLFIRYSGRYATGGFVGEIQSHYGLNEGDKLYKVIK